MMTNLLLATIVVLDLGSGWGSRFTDCTITTATWTAARDGNYLYGVCTDGEVINLPTAPERETPIALDELIVSDGADAIERQGCSLVSDRTFGGEREITVVCGAPVFGDGYEY